MSHDAHRPFPVGAIARGVLCSRHGVVWTVLHFGCLQFLWRTHTGAFLGVHVRVHLRVDDVPDGVSDVDTIQGAS